MVPPSMRSEAGARKRWLFAEGSQGFFFTYLLLANPVLVLVTDGTIEVETEQDEAVIGESSLASPVFDSYGEVVGAIGVVIPFGVATMPLRPIYHMSSFIWEGVPNYEIRQAGGMTDKEVRQGFQAALDMEPPVLGC